MPKVSELNVDDMPEYSPHGTIVNVRYRPDAARCLFHCDDGSYTLS